MIQLPKGIPKWTNDLKQEAMRLGNPEIPKILPSKAHNALEDAPHSKIVSEFLNNLKDDLLEA